MRNYEEEDEADRRLEAKLDAIYWSGLRRVLVVWAIVFAITSTIAAIGWWLTRAV